MAINDVLVRGNEVFVDGRRVYPVQALSEPVHNFAWAEDRAREGYKVRNSSGIEYHWQSDGWWLFILGNLIRSAELNFGGVDRHDHLTRTDWETCGKRPDEIHDFKWATAWAKEGHKVKCSRSRDYSFFLRDGVWFVEYADGVVEKSHTLAFCRIAEDETYSCQTDWETCGRALDPPPEKKYGPGSWFHLPYKGKIVLCRTRNGTMEMLDKSGLTATIYSTPGKTGFTLKELQSVWGSGLEPLPDKSGLGRDS